MQIAFDVEPEDLVALYAERLSRSSAVRRQTARLRLVLGGLALGGVLAVGFSAGGGHLGIWIAGGVAGALAGYLGFPRWFRGAALHRARQRYESARGGAACGRHHLTIEEAGLRARSEGEEHLARWEEVGELYRARDHVFLFVGPTRAHVIPVARVVGGDLLAFIQEAQARVGARGTGVAKETS